MAVVAADFIIQIKYILCQELLADLIRDIIIENAHRNISLKVHRNIEIKNSIMTYALRVILSISEGSYSEFM